MRWSCQRFGIRRPVAAVTQITCLSRDAVGLRRQVAEYQSGNRLPHSKNILLTALWIYLPMLLAAPTDVVAPNFFFDTMLFCEAILLRTGFTKNQLLRGFSAKPSTRRGRSLQWAGLNN